MEVALQMPDDIVQHMREKWGNDIPRHVLEGFALECFRARVLGESQLRRLFGFKTRFELHGFLKEHKVSFYALEDLENDRPTLDRLGL
jgi:hypothetical protein